MFSARELLKQRLDTFNAKISEHLDFDFSAVSKRVDTLQEFDEFILSDFLSKKQLFYRGERINDPNRHLLPTMLRNPEKLFKDDDLGIIHIDSDFIFNYYSSLGNFVDVFNATMGKSDADSLYEICAFAQHYYDFSPLIDFTKSLYPSLSFALKDRKIYDEDIVLYVLQLKNNDDYTTDINTANLWLKNINIYASYFEEKKVKEAVRDMIENKKIPMNDDFRRNMEQIAASPAPRAKLIDVPTNTRMKFQQGVFLLLTDFQLFNVTYFTRNIREHFTVTKYIINKDICPSLNEMIKRETPWYTYDCLTDVEYAFKKAVNNNPD
ncbi:MAG: FRG domain-containing protein [Eubacterium sp.]